MTIPPLTIIPAGAGSGKTHTIQATLARWVTSGAVAANRIVAVTFTEAAAGELRDRIRAELVSRGRLDDALKLERSYISTIHGFGLRVLGEFAFDAGMSPSPRLLSEDEEAILIRTALSSTSQAEEVMGDLSAYGYSYDYNSGKGPEDQFRDRVLHLIGRLRAIGRAEEDAGITSHALKKVTDLYGPTRSAEFLNDALRQAVSNLLRQFPEDLSGLYAGNNAAQKAFRSDFLALKRAQQTGKLDQDWKLWQSLRQLRLSKRGSDTPQGYDDLAIDVMEAAAMLPQHPGPLAQALRHVEGLLGASQDLLEHYAARKKEQGLVDYSDMVALSHRLLTQRADVLEELRGRVDCLVIDEFQDTNPLQFALLWSLVAAGVPAVVVGDLKQAIMGFQNADPRLLENLILQHPGEASPLTGNWRSTPAVMKWINKIGEALFGSGYTRLKPMAGYPSSQTSLEVIDFPDAPAHGSTRIPAQHTAVRIRDLLADPEQAVYDKCTRTTRRLRGGDIAVICPTWPRLERYAEALRALGIRTRMQEEGWFASRVVQIALHALAYVADPADRHAALYLAVTELGRYDLEQAVEEMLDGKRLDDPVLAKLDVVTGCSPHATVGEVVTSVLEAMDLYGVSSSWRDGASARANLLRLQGEAEEFMGANREALASGRYYGTGLKSFLAWLRGKAERDDQQPPPRVLDEDAVVLTTWHSSKGREWPVVAVCSTDVSVGARFPDVAIAYEDFADLSCVLEKARVEISPEFVAPETTERFEAPLLGPARQGALRLLYVGLTRAREKVILECHRYQKPETVSYWNILQDVGDIEVAGNKMTVKGEEFDCRVVQTTKQGPAEFEEPCVGEVETLAIIGRRAIRKGAMPPGLTPEAVTPSSLHEEGGGTGSAGASPVSLESYAPPLQADLGLQGFDRGTFLHKCFETGTAEEEKLQLVADCLGVKLPGETATAIGAAVRSFEDWLQKRMAPVQVYPELPFVSLDENGSVVSGSIDLLVESADGVWIVDHKSDQYADLEERFAYYRPQLDCYAKAVASIHPGREVLGIVINWISHGKASILMR